MDKPVVVLVGTGSIGQAIARRTGAGKKVLLADLKPTAAEAAARTFADAGFDAEPVQCDLGSRESVLALVERAEFLMSSRGRWITGADFLIDGGCTASYHYGDLQYLKATH